MTGAAPASSGWKPDALLLSYIDQAAQKGFEPLTIRVETDRSCPLSYCAGAAMEGFEPSPLG